LRNIAVSEFKRESIHLHCSDWRQNLKVWLKKLPVKLLLLPLRKYFGMEEQAKQVKLLPGVPFLKEKKVERENEQCRGERR